MEMFEDFNSYVDSLDDAILEKEKQRLEELSKNPPKDVDFTYSQEELDRIISSYMNELEKRKTSNLSDNGRTIEDYEEVWNNNQAVPSDIVKLVDSYNKLADKNDINNVEHIVRQINDKYSKDLMKLPVEIDKTIDEIKEHLQWLYQKRDLDRYLKGKQEKTTAEEEQKRVEQTRMQEQQERSAYIQSKIDTINSKINVIKTNEELFEPLRVDLLKERTYFYNKKDNIEASDIDRLNNYLAKLDSLEQEVINKKAEVEVPKNNQDEEEINRLKEQIAEYNKQIAIMIQNMQPYMQISKVNREMTKVIEKNTELDFLTIVDSLTDYKRLAETKKELVDFLVKADTFIKTRVEQQINMVKQPVVTPVVEEPVMKQPMVDVEPESNSGGMRM